MGLGNPPRQPGPGPSAPPSPSSVLLLGFEPEPLAPGRRGAIGAVMLADHRDHRASGTGPCPINARISPKGMPPVAIRSWIPSCAICTAPSHERGGGHGWNASGVATLAEPPTLS